MVLSGWYLKNLANLVSFRNIRILYTETSRNPEKIETVYFDLHLPFKFVLK